jgi:hypothetical protein
LRIFGKVFPPLLSLRAPVQILWLRLATLRLGAFAPLRWILNADNRNASCVPSAEQQWPFLRVLSLFAANQWKFLSMNTLHATLSSSGQPRSRLIKANQDIFLKHLARRSTTPSPHHSITPRPIFHPMKPQSSQKITKALLIRVQRCESVAHLFRSVWPRRAFNAFSRPIRPRRDDFGWFGGPKVV